MASSEKKDFSKTTDVSHVFIYTPNIQRLEEKKEKYFCESVGRSDRAARPLDHIISSSSYD
jgi:hypothetical protein